MQLTKPNLQFYQPLMALLLFSVSLSASAWKMEAGRINLSSTSSLSALQQHSFQQIYDTPPIVVALPTTRGGDASALRISNVTTTGFRMSPVEPNSEDGPHASMTVAYIAIEAGTHSLPNGEVIEAGLITTREQQFNGIPTGQKGWESLTFSQSFSNPIVLADIQTISNESNGIPRRSSSPWLTVALDNISNTGADIALERSEEFDSRSGSNYRFNRLGSDESIGYVVMDSALAGNFRANGNQLIQFESLYRSNLVDGWNQGCDNLGFGSSYSATPIVVATKSSHNEDDGGWLRECSVNNTRIQLTIDEDTAQDRERNHANEDVSALLFSNSFFYDSNASVAATSQHLLMEADSVDLNPGRFTQVNFKQIYDTPPAVFILENDNNPEPSSVRIRNVTQSGFEAVPVEPDSRVADATDQLTTIHYLAVTKGEFQFPDGKRIEVGPLFPPEEIANFQAKRLSGDSWFNFNFANSFSSTPALISTIQSMNSENAHVPGSPSQPWLTMAIRNITAAGGQLALDRAETNTGTLSSAEEIAYLAIEPGIVGSFQDIDGKSISSEAQRTADNITGTRSCINTNFLQAYSGSPLVVGSQMTWDGGDGGWLRRCSTSSSRVSLKIEEDWASDTDNAHTTERAGFMVFNEAFQADFSLVANYQLEGPVWNGSAGEVTDSSDTGANGRRFGDAQPQPAQVCYGAHFDGNRDYIEVPDNAALDIDEELTVMAWVNADTLPSSGLSTLISKDNNYEFHLDTSGRIFWWWNTDGGATRSFTSSSALTLGRWHHVAIVYSRANGSQQIFIDGIESAARSYANESLANNAIPLFIGTDYNYPSRDFDGAIDEVKIFKRALPAAAVQQYAAASRACASCTLGSFEITQDSYGLACPDTPAQVNIVAKCLDGSTKTDYVGSVDLSGPSGAGFFSDASSGTAITSLSYQTSDLGEKSAYLYFDDENPNVQVSATDTSASVSSTATTGTDFRSFGFRVSQQPVSFACGDSIAMTVQAYGQTDNAPSGACAIVEGFSGSKNIDAWFSATLDDDNSPETVTTPLMMATTPILAQSSSANNNLNLTFASGEASFNLAYANAARILEVNIRHDDVPYDGSQFSALAASSNDFVVRPDNFSLSAQSGGSDLNGVSASAGTHHPAGASFDLGITAICTDGSTATDYAPNASNTLVAYLQRTGPTGGSSVDGDMQISASRILTSNTSAIPSWSASNLGSGAFSAGRFSYAGAHYSEVGLTRLHIKDQDYFGEETGTATLDIGRFTPDYFELVTSSGTLASYCTPSAAPAFTYSGQAFGYATVPSMTITARNRAGQATRNYTESGYLKLVTSDITRSFPSTDTTQTGADSSTLVAVSSSPNLPSAFASSGSGVMQFNFDANDAFTYTRNNNALIAPFNSDLLIQVTGVSDSDGVSANAAPYDITPGVTEIRYGRWAIENTFGPEITPLGFPMRVEHFDGTRFQTNTSDSCTSYDASNAMLTQSLSGGSTSASGSGTLSNGEGPSSGAINLSAPGAGNVGSVLMEYQGDSWLQFDWDNNPLTTDTHPTATATFGQYRGHDRIIYWREVLN